MIKTDFDLTHNDKASIVNAVVATPFNRYENVRTTITKTGSLDDFTATVEVLYSLNWTASLKHKYSANEIHTAALLKAPYLPDTVSLGFNYTGKLTDFSANIDYILNPNYRTLSEAKFKYNFPEVYLLSKMTTAIEKDVRVNEVLLRHTQDFKTNEVAKVSSQFLANIREKKVNVDFNMNYNGKNSAIALWSFNTNLTVETPQPDFAKSVLVYSLVSESDFKQQQHLVFETPMLEKLTMIDSNTFDEQTITRSQKWMYGGDLFSQEQFWQKGRYTYSITTPFKGYEETRMELRYSEFNDWMNKQPISADLSFTSSNLSAPVKMAANAVIDAPNGAFNALNFSAVTTYAKDQKHTFDLAYKPGYANSKMTSTKQGYELSSAELSYSLEKVNGIIKSSMLSAPVEYSGITKLRTWKDFVITHKFTSPFEYVKHAEFQVQNQVVSGENKPGVLLKYIGAGKKDQVFSVKPSWTWKVRDAGNMKMSTALSMESPFEQFNNLDISWGHEHAIAPLRIKESALVKFNDKKYLDLETEFGALNKMLGVIAVHAPRQMEFSFTGVNEGESVNGDLNLNWDKQNSNSNFRMQFGLADSGTKNSIKKDFSIRFTHPGRIVSLRNGYENSDGKISSLGNIFWDEEKRQGVSYDASYTKLVIRGVETHSSTVTVTLPTRKIEVSGSSTSKGSKQVASAKVYWDANNDPLKVVEVNFEMNPTDVKKAALITVKLPSKNKEVSLSTELAVNDGVRLLDGETRFTYSPDADKTVVMKYTIQQTDSSYRSSWSVDHVATDTHMKMTSDLSSSDTVTKGDLSVLYNSQQANTLAFNLQGQLNMEQKSASLQVGSSVEKASISAKLSTESPYMVTVETARNTVPTWRSVWRVDTAARSLDVSVTYDNMKGQVVTKAFFPNETRLVSETSTSRDAASTQQARLVSELNDRHLHAKMSWRKDLFSDIANYGSSTVKGAVSEMSPVMRQSFNTLSNTLQDKQKAIASSMREELSPIIDTYKEEIKVLEREVSKMRQELRRMYNNNDLYMKDVEKWFLAAAARAIEANNAFVIRMETVYQQGRAVLDRAYNELNSYPYLEKYRTLARTAENSLKEANEVLIKELNLAIQKVMEGLNKIAGVYDEMITNISQELIKLLQALVKEFTLAPFMADIEAAIVRLQADLRLSEAAKANMTRALEQLQQMLNEVLNTNDLMESYEAFSEGSQRILREHFGNLADNKDVQDIKKALQLMYQQVLKIHQFLEKNLSAKDMVETVLQMLRDQVLSDFKQLPLGLLDLPKSRVTTFDLVNGNVEFDLYLPIPMENFEDAMKFTMSGYLSKLQGLADKYFPRGDFCLWDLYYRLPPVRWSAQKDWIPPFDAVGTISGKQHIMTFDGRHYDLAGLCSYMLAADLVNNTFSVILRYDGNQKDLKPQSIVVMVDGRTIEISSSYLMKVDGKPAEMPYTADGLSILRRGQWVTLDSAQGVKVVSDFSNQYHMVHLSGWYFGKVGGLFGNFDNEHYNDWTKPDGSLETQDRKLLNSWEVAGTCRPQMQRVVIDDDVKTRNDQCTEVFDSSLSNLRPCFLMVSPNPYRQNCDVSPGDVCKQAALYREICAGQNIDVDLPPQCVKCAASGDASGTVKYGAGGDQPAPVTMDTVFIVEEAPCNKNIQDKLKDIVITLDQKSVDAGKQENRYSLVGYYDGTPTTYTIEGQLFNQAVKFAKGVENLRFNGVQGRTSDLLSVLQHVTSLPYRPGVKKTVVLVSCTPCDIYKDFSYHQLRTLLRQQDISLHVLRDSGFNLQTNRAPQNHIFGMDNEKLFAGQSVEPDLYQDMEKPSDYCASLALESRGAVFDSSNLHAGSVKHQRDFIGQFGVRLQQQNEPVCQVCNCELDSTGSPVTVCRRCDSQPINFQPPTTMIKKLTEYKNALTQNIQALLY
ncbi:hypothetical protein DPMN_105036 [Dreissena polymorpha]|uniref:VWFD domain-containing protein n=2 Tax=Dreissena polymorpha TaxID=45954 RepID=A0A9D4H8U5_DREPO|nr:hypothetical protein DPMN_105036 [Dreissena polymorpha]